MEDKLTISAPPHIKSDESLKKIMWWVVVALLPAGAAGVYIFGLWPLYIIGISIASALLTEAVIQKLTKKSVSISDGSAIITGLLMAYNLPPGVPLWLPAVGAFVGIAIGKQAFGGLGHNIFNPALVGRAFLMVSWPKYMTSWTNPRWWPEGISTATPLAAIKEHQISGTPHLYSALTEGGHRIFSYLYLFMGNRGGCIGEVCILALLIGAAFLLYKKYISWHTPFTFIITVGVLSWAFMGNNLFEGDWLFYILTGGLVLGAFFMATDMVTTPLTRKGKVVFGVGCGLITFCIRKWGGYPEGVSYSILMMNAATPLLDRFTKPKKFGAR